MDNYYVNTNAQTNGDHEVHKESCSYLPSAQNRIFLGKFSTCAEAVIAARVHFVQVDGCRYCSYACHTQ